MIPNPCSVTACTTLPENTVIKFYSGRMLSCMRRNAETFHALLLETYLRPLWKIGNTGTAEKLLGAEEKEEICMLVHTAAGKQ